MRSAVLHTASLHVHLAQNRSQRQPPLIPLYLTDLFELYLEMMPNLVVMVTYRFSYIYMKGGRVTHSGLYSRKPGMWYPEKPVLVTF